MKTKFCLTAVIAGLTGCQTAPVTPPTPPAAPPTPAPLVAPLAVRIAEVVKTYTLGAYVDPDDPTLRHEAHTVQRIVSPAHWNLAPSAQRAAAVSLESNVVPSSLAQPPAPPPASALVAPAVASAPAPATDPEPAITPNAAGVIDLTAQVGNDSGEVNPFAVRKVAADTVREISLHLAGIVMGPKPCGVINDNVVDVGTVIEGLTVRRIEPAAVVLQWGERRLRLPLSDQPTRVRVAF